MKKNFLSWLFIGLFATTGFTACSDDDDDDNLTNVSFPEKVVVNKDANETAEITFNATGNWTLASSQMWCTLGNNGEYSLNGAAGQQTVTIHIGEEAQNTSSKSAAQLTLTMGGQSAVIADVVRNAKGMTFKVTDADGNEVDVIEVGYDEFNTYHFEANFRFAATNRPDWVELEGGAIVGTPNGAVKGGLKFAANGTAEKYSIDADKGYTISFSDEKGLCTKEYTVIYKGMPAKMMDYQGPQNFGWVVSMDGQTFTQTTESGLDNTTTNLTFPGYVPFTIKALNDEYVPVVFEVVSMYGMEKINMDSPETPVDWIKVEDKGKGTVWVKVEPSYDGAERKGLVMMFPKAKYDELTENDSWYGVDGVVVTNPDTFFQEIAWEYQQSNLLMQFDQKELKQGGGSEVEEVPFKVSYYDADWNPVEPELTKVTDEVLVSEYGENVPIYSMTYPTGQFSSFLIDPKMEGDYNVTWHYWAGMGNMDLTESENIEFDGAGSISLWFPDEAPSKMISIIIKDHETWASKKVLLIMPN